MQHGAQFEVIPAGAADQGAVLVMLDDKTRFAVARGWLLL